MLDNNHWMTWGCLQSTVSLENVSTVSGSNVGPISFTATNTDMPPRIHTHTNTWLKVLNDTDTDIPLRIHTNIDT